MTKRLPVVLSTLLFFSCTDKNYVATSGTTEAYVPIYASAAGITQISVEQARPTLLAGKIYAYSNYIFQNDLNSGVHIIDNTNRSSPKKVAFINIPLSTEIAVKGNYLYANNYTDIVVIDISDPAKPVLVKRISKVFPPVNQKYPPLSNVSFECPDASKGVVVNWELHTIKTPNCRR